MRQRKRGKNLDKRAPPRLPQRTALIVPKRDANLHKPVKRLPPPKWARQLRAVVLLLPNRQQPLKVAKKVAPLVQHLPKKVTDRVKRRQTFRKVPLRRRLKQVVHKPPKLRVQRPLVVPKLKKHVQKQLKRRRLMRPVAKPVKQRAKRVRNKVCAAGRRTKTPDEKPSNKKTSGQKLPNTKKTAAKNKSDEKTYGVKPTDKEPPNTKASDKKKKMPKKKTAKKAAKQK